MERSHPAVDHDGELADLAAHLDRLVSRLSGDVLALDHQRRVCAQLAERHEALAARIGDGDDGGLADTARELARLLRLGEAALEAVGADVEAMIAKGGRVADGTGLAPGDARRT